MWNVERRTLDVGCGMRGALHPSSPFGLRRGKLWDVGR
jgi:hypothetical protein